MSTWGGTMSVGGSTLRDTDRWSYVMGWCVCVTGVFHMLTTQGFVRAEHAEGDDADPGARACTIELHVG